MGNPLPRYYEDRREYESTLGHVYKLVMIAGHSVTEEPLFIMESLQGCLSEAVPFTEIGKTWKIVRKPPAQEEELACP